MASAFINGNANLARSSRHGQSGCLWASNSIMDNL